MCGPSLQVRIMFGLAATGSGQVAVITGARVPGNTPGKAMAGNQVIGKTAAGGTDGVRAAGIDNLIKAHKNNSR
jgi:hypothetical protein